MHDKAPRIPTTRSLAKGASRVAFGMMPFVLAACSSGTTSAGASTRTDGGARSDAGSSSRSDSGAPIGEGEDSGFASGSGGQDASGPAPSEDSGGPSTEDSGGPAATDSGSAGQVDSGPGSAVPMDAGMGATGTGETPGLSPALSAAPPYTCVTNFYVDAVNGKDGNAGSQASPWQTLTAATGSSKVTAGSCVNVLPGTYNMMYGIDISKGGSSNSTTGYVVYRSTQPQGAKLLAAASMYSMVGIEAPYVIIDGFEIDGNGAKAGGNGVDGCTIQKAGVAHHITVINNLVHDVGGGGIGACFAEYYTFSHNVVYGSAGTNTYQDSGIGIWEPGTATNFTATAADNTTFHVVISYNISHDNIETYSCGGKSGCHTDGEGIIIDTTNQSAGTKTPYPGQTLVLGNLVYNNGGRGIQVGPDSSNTTVANNTAYNDNLDTNDSATWRGEIANATSSNDTFVNNIGYAVVGSGILKNNSSLMTGDSTSKTPWSNNLGFGGPVVSSSTDPIVTANNNQIGVDPMLTDVASGNFAPLSGSPVLGAGATASYVPATAPDIGAY